MIMESTPSQVNWHPVNRPKAPGMHRMGVLQEVSHGSNAINYFQLHQSRGSSEMYHGAVIGHDLRDDTRIFKEVTQVGENLMALQPVLDTTAQQAKVAIVYDYDNMWALSDVRNYAGETIKYWRTIQEQYQYFWEHDIPVEFISTQDDLSTYQLVIDPMHFLMTTDFADKLNAYVAQGGTLVGSYISGQVDERYLAYLGGWLKPLHEVYGMEPIETDTLYPTQSVAVADTTQQVQAHDYATIMELDTAQALAHYTSDWYADSPAVTVNKFGKGAAYYVGARFDQAYLATFYKKIVTDLQLEPASPIEKMTKAIHVNIREDNNQAYFFVQNFADKATTITITTPVIDILTGEEIAVGNHQMAAYDGLVLVKKN
jgi:beta-galactosidase